jgi:predicted DNA-binding antitoxin AbrB/MazE fold protein
MAITVEATYEHGQLSLKEPLSLPEGTLVQVTIAPLDQECRPSQPPLAERIVARARALTSGALDGLPNDLAAQHDHYLYGTPKRTE